MSEMAGVNLHSQGNYADAELAAITSPRSQHSRQCRSTQRSDFIRARARAQGYQRDREQVEIITLRSHLPVSRRRAERGNERTHRAATASRQTGRQAGKRLFKNCPRGECSGRRTGCPTAGACVPVAWRPARRRPK